MTTSVASEAASPLASNHKGSATLVKFTMLDLSTAHLSSVTRELMDNDATDAILFKMGDYGWFVHVPSKSDGIDVGEHCPRDLAACIHFAQEHGADWIMFDTDAKVVPGLPDYEDAIAGEVA
jgi:hypothetical protein